MKHAVLLFCLALFPRVIQAQGTIQFNNRAVGIFEYPISDCHGPLRGPDWTAQLWGGPIGTPAEDLRPLLPTTGFLTEAPGYLMPVIVKAPELGWAACVQIRVWNNAGGTINSFTEATVRAVSPAIEVFPLGSGSPPFGPAYLDQLGEEPLLVVQSPGCEPPTDRCCFVVGFSLTNISLLESQSLTHISVARNKLVADIGSAGPEHTVRYVMEDVTAHAGEDYIAQTGTVNFASPSYGWIDLDLLDNPTWSGSRTFRVRLLDPSENVEVGWNDTVTVTITDDDTVLSPRRGVDGPIHVVVATSNSKWLVGGDFAHVDGYSRGRIALLEPDGTLDPAFDPGTGANRPVFSIVRQPDGMYLVGGSFTSFAGTDRALLVRLNPTGSLDPTFASAIAPEGLPVPDGASAVRYLIRQPDGKLLVAGIGLGTGPIANAGVLRLNFDGSLDTTFVPPLTVTNATVLALQPDGKVLVGLDNGYSDGWLVRLDSDGSPDPAFNANLRAISYRAVRGVSALTVLPGGQVLVGGDSVFSEGDLGLLVLEPSGKPATGQVSLTLGGALIVGGYARSMAWQTGDRLLIAGGWELQVSNGVLCCPSSLIRLDADLSQDLTFNPSEGEGVRTFSIQEDGTIGGISSSYRDNRLLLFHEDGHPVQDLHFDGIARLADGQIHLALRGASPWTGYLQVSSNLVNWETITNSYWELQGRGFKETMVTNAPQRFYRTSRLP